MPEAMIVASRSMVRATAPASRTPCAISRRPTSRNRSWRSVCAGMKAVPFSRSTSCTPATWNRSSQSRSERAEGKQRSRPPRNRLAMERRDSPSSFGSKRPSIAQTPASASRCSTSDTRSNPATLRTSTARIICASLQPWAGLPLARGRPARMRFAASTSNNNNSPPRAVVGRALPRHFELDRRAIRQDHVLHPAGDAPRGGLEPLTHCKQWPSRALTPFLLADRG